MNQSFESTWNVLHKAKLFPIHNFSVPMMFYVSAIVDLCPRTRFGKERKHFWNAAIQLRKASVSVQGKLAHFNDWKFVFTLFACIPYHVYFYYYFQNIIDVLDSLIVIIWETLNVEKWTFRKSSKVEKFSRGILSWYEFIKTLCC